MSRANVGGARACLGAVLRRVRVREVAAFVFIFAVSTVVVQFVALLGHADAGTPLLLRQSHNYHPRTCRARPPPPPPPPATERPSFVESVWRVRRQRLFTALERTGPTLTQLMAEARERNLLLGEAEVAPVTAIASHDEAWTICRQTRALLSQHARPSGVWVVTYGVGSLATSSERAAREAAAQAALAEQRRAPEVVKAVRLVAELREYGALQLALQSPTPYVVLLEPHAIPSHRFLRSALAAAALDLADGRTPAVYGEAGCVVLPASAVPARGAGGEGDAPYAHLCAPDSSSGLVIEHALDVDYLDGMALLHESWAKLVLGTEPPAGLGPGGAMLALSDGLRRLLGVRTTVLPVETVLTGDAGARRAESWPASSRGPTAPDRAVSRALRAGMAPVALGRHGRVRVPIDAPAAEAGGAEARADAEPGGFGPGADADAGAQPAPTERWLLVGADDAAGRQLLRVLAPHCARARRGAAAAAAEPRRVRCDVAVGRAPGGSQPGASDASSSPPAADDGAAGAEAAGDMVWGRSFALADGWFSAVEAESSVGEARRLARVLAHLRETVQPTLVIAAVGDGARPCPLAVAVRTTFGGAESDAPWADAAARGLQLSAPPAAHGADAEAAPYGQAPVPRARLPILLPRPQLETLSWLGTLSPRALAAWHAPRVVIVVITWRRAHSLKRLCNALASADYLGDEVPIRFALDANADDPTHRFISQFHWPHGPKSVHARAAHAGLATAVVESWTPASDDEYAVLLEDDIEVAPSFYAWLKYALLMYRYSGEAAADPDMIGISLYTPRLVEVKIPRRRVNLHAELRGQPFAQQLPCSWGALFYAQPWRNFREWLLLRTGADSPKRIAIPDSAVPGWKGSWKKFLIELMYLRAKWMLYPNFRNQSSFSTNHLEPGEHIAAKANTLDHDPADFTVPLLRHEFASMLPGGSLPRRADQLVRLDLWSNLTDVETASKKGVELYETLAEA